MKKFVLGVIVLISSSAFAGETGILFQGKQYPLYRDGKKVGEEPKEARLPAGAGEAVSEAPPYFKGTIYYTLDDKAGVVCYHDSSGKSLLSCVKK